MTTEQPDAGTGPASWIARLVLALLALVPMMLSSPGQVTADSRQYLYLRPGSFLERATSLWDPSIAGGTVPHQHLGFLWPMGPWFWLVDVSGLPTWVGQRLWLAALAAAAGLGAHRLARAVGCRPLAALVVAVVYQLTPYQLAFTARFSVLLLPWAALPWLVHLARRSVHERTWRGPLAFGIVASTAGAVNASSLLLVLVAPGIVLLGLMVAGPWRPALAASLRLALTTSVASAWWLAGLVVQGRYGLPVLQLTENVDTVSAASRPDDVVRGLGNWIFVSTDGATTVIEQAAAYTDSTVVRLATIALPALALLVLAAVRFRGRGAIAAAMAVAAVVGTGAAPLGSTSRYGELWRRISESSSVGLALRNTPRIVPVLVLGTAVSLGIGIQRLSGRVRIAGAVGVIVLAAVAISPVATHGFLSDDFDRPEALPEHWTQVAADLDAIAIATDSAAPGRRVLELPGANFAAYTWGNTVEPVLPGLIDRPTIAREVLPAGGPGTVDLLAALDRGLLLGTFDDASLAPVARLLGVGDIVVRGDLDVDRFGLPPVGPLIDRFDRTPPAGFRVTGRYGTDPEGRPSLLRLTLDEPTSLVRADAGAPVLLAGDGAGIVDAAGAGIIDGRRTILPSVATDAVALDDALARGAEVVVTDTNRKAATTFFYTIVDNHGATETAAATEPDPTGYDVRFGPYADADIDEKTVALQVGGTVTASMGGGPERPEYRPVQAFDGSGATAWRPRVAPVGQRLEVRYDEPVTADEITILTTADAPVTAVRVVVDGVAVDVDLGDEASVAPGQVVALPVDSIRDLAIEITAVSPTAAAPGLAEVDVGGAVVDEVLRVPTALVERVGERAAGRRVTYVLTRQRGDVLDPGRTAIERDIDRRFATAVDAAYEVTGRVALDGPPPTGCRDDLVRIDGAPVPVAVDVDGQLTGCAAVTLAAGEHHLVTAEIGGAVDVDRLVLASGPAPAAPTLLTPTDATLDTRSASATLDATTPFWFTLAESRNDGWEIDVSGGSVLATSMTDGYANGWLVTPDGNGPVQIRLSWTPQRIVWAGFAITGLLVPAVIVVYGGPRRRRPVLDDVGSREWHASSVGGASVPIRLAGLGGATLASAVLWWFVADATIATVAVVALVARAVTRHARLPLAGLAALALVAAELTERPSLVFAGMALAVAEIAVSAILRDQDLISAWNETPGSGGRGYQ